MKKVLLLLGLCLVAGQLLAQKTVYFEGFNNNQKQWTNKETAEYNSYIYDGYFILTHKRNRGSWVFWNNATFDSNKDYTIETQLQKVYGPADNYYGLEFGRKDNRVKYGLYISASGHYKIKLPGQQTTTAVRTEFVNNYSPNHLKVVKQGDRIGFYLNGEFLRDYAFEAFPGDKIGFSVSKAAKVKVDYIRISLNDKPIYQARTSTNNFKEKSFSFYNLEKLVKQKVEEDFTAWAKKDEFETSSQYRQRIENREEAIRRLTEEAIEFYKKKYLGTVDFTDFSVHTYDADAQTFKITMNRLGDFYLHVPLTDARQFKEDAARLKFRNFDLKIKDNQWVLSYLDVYDPNSGKTFSYDITKAPDYNPVSYNAEVTGVRVELPEMEGEIARKPSGQPKEQNIVLGEPDVDVKIPFGDTERDNTYAIIIGNEDYTKYNPELNADSDVEFARRDAEIFKEYADKTLGIPEDNIIYLTDAISTQMQREITRIVTMAKVRNGELIFYYAGHGFPDSESKDAYIMPVDVTALEMKDRGIALSDLYAQLSDEEISRTTVFLDACFSGGGRKQGLMGSSRFAKIKPNKGRLEGNVVVFSASSGTQVSKPYEEKKHGMFTYYLLKKLKETKGEVTYGELYEYLNKEVTYTAVKKYAEQTPEVNTSMEVEDKWQNWKF